MFAVWENEEYIRRLFSLLIKVNKRRNSSDVRRKAIPQMCPTVAETTFQEIGMGLT